MIQPEKIHIISINIFKANLETQEAYLDHPVKPASFSFDFGNQIAHNFEDGRSRIRLFFHLAALNEADEKLGVEVEYGIEFHFQVETFQDFVKAKEEVPQINLDFVATLLGMAFSTARGIIFERTRGTFFEGIVLPVIDPYKALLAEEAA